MNLTEKDLHSFWQNSRYFEQPLLSTDGRRIEIIRRGKYNLDAGPDFLDAVLKIDGRLFNGDIEIHLDGRDWYNHKHDLDPAYNNTLLHVALETNSPPEAITCENGKTVREALIPADVLPRVQKDQKLKNRLEPLQFCPLRESDQNDILTTVEIAGKHRLRQKTARFDELVDKVSWDQLLYSGVCEAIGYSKNRKPFRQLTDILPIDLLFSELHHLRDAQSEMLISALLFGGAGFFESLEERALDAVVADYVMPRRQLWERLRYPLQLRPIERAAWVSFKLRPQNFPARRIAGVVELVLRFYQKGMLETLIACAGAGENPVKRAISELRNFFVVKAEGFWAGNYDFASRKNPERRNKPLGALIGARRADDLLVNIVLPILKLYAESSNNSSLANRIDEIFANFPTLQKNEITRKMHAQLFLQKPPPRQIANRALFQQGLLHLHKNFCAPLRCQLCLNLREQSDHFIF